MPLFKHCLVLIVLLNVHFVLLRRFWLKKTAWRVQFAVVFITLIASGCDEWDQLKLKCIKKRWLIGIESSVWNMSKKKKKQQVFEQKGICIQRKCILFGAKHLVVYWSWNDFFALSAAWNNLEWEEDDYGDVYYFQENIWWLKNPSNECLLIEIFK